MKRTRIAFALVIASLAVCSMSCKSGSNAAAPASGTPAAGAPAGAAGEASLYARLGGADGVHALVNQAVDNITHDLRVGHFFADTDLEPFKKSFATLIGQVTGGPEKYTGRDMKTTHSGLGIHEADFKALIEDVGRALDQVQAGEKEKAELIALLTPMKKDIIEP